MAKSEPRSSRGVSGLYRCAVWAVSWARRGLRQPGRALLLLVQYSGCCSRVVLSLAVVVVVSWSQEALRLAWQPAGAQKSGQALRPQAGSPQSPWQQPSHSWRGSWRSAPGADLRASFGRGWLRRPRRVSVGQASQ